MREHPSRPTPLAPSARPHLAVFAGRLIEESRCSDSRCWTGLSEILRKMQEVGSVAN